jgi:hypothetical protein
MASRPCTCDNFVRGQSFKPGRDCKLCWRYWQSDTWHRRWGGTGRMINGTIVEGAAAAVKRASAECRHRGEPTGEQRQCGTCPGSVSVKVFGCSVHGACTLAKKVEGLACCKGCPDREPVPPALPQPVTRNLLYHVAPASGNGVWQRNVEQLLKRIDLFNGRRVVAIVTGRARRLDYAANFKLDPPEAVKEAFRGHVEEFLVLPNDPRLREVVTFRPLLDRVADADPSQITFYGHAKGVTRPVNDGVTVHRWTDIMHETCLDHMPLVEEQLARHPITGSFKKLGQGFGGSRSAWHYSGSFYWLRNSAVFSRRNWQLVDRQWWGSESWPGLLFSPSEAGCLFHEGAVGVMDLFSMDYLKGVVEPEYTRWKEQHRARLAD